MAQNLHKIKSVNMNMGGVHKALAEELVTIYGCWVKETLFSLVV